MGNCLRVAVRDDALPGLLAHGLHGGAVLCGKHFYYGVGKLAGVEKIYQQAVGVVFNKFLHRRCAAGNHGATMRPWLQGSSTTGQRGKSSKRGRQMAQQEQAQAQAEWLRARLKLWLAEVQAGI